MIRTRLSRVLAATLFATLPALGAESSFWSPSNSEAFLRGEIEGLSVDPDGALRLAPALKTLWGPDRGVVWDVAAGEDSEVFLALSEPARVVRLRAATAPETRFEGSPESWITALGGGNGQALYAGVSPEGTVLRSEPDGSMQPWLETGSQYVWGLAVDGRGRVWAATGSPGRLLRLTAAGESEPAYESGDDPVRCVTGLPGGGVVAGTGKQGRVVSIGSDGRPFVLFDADEDEIVAVAVDRSGAVFALAASGGRRTAAPSPKPAASSNGEPGNGSNDGQNDVNSGGTAPAANESKPGTTSVRVTASAPSGGGRLYRIEPNGDVVTLWSSNDALPYSLALDRDGRPWIGAGDDGRVYRIAEDRSATVLLTLPSSRITALAASADGQILIGASGDARLVMAGPSSGPEGVYLSEAVDAGWVADWGRLLWNGGVPEGAGVEIRVRAGNTSGPDDSWSPWQDVKDARPGIAIATAVPPTRWFQVRVRLTSARSGASPVVRGLELAYQTRNRPPILGKVTIDSPGVAWARGPTPSSSRNRPLVADDPVTRQVVASLAHKSRPGPIRKAYERGVRTFSWEARDPDGDRMWFSLEVQRVGEDDWFPLATRIEDTFYSWDARGVPDGRLRVRLQADDAPDNAAGANRIERRVSDPFAIDHTPPTITGFDVSSGSGATEIRVTAWDPGGEIAILEYAVDGDPWSLVIPVDGVADSETENYVVEIPRDPEGPEVLLRLRVLDRSGNVVGDMRVIDQEH